MSTGEDNEASSGGLKDILTEHSEPIEVSVEPEQSGGGLKDILAKVSEDGAKVDSSDIPPSDGEDMDDRNRPDQRDAVAYNAWISQRANER